MAIPTCIVTTVRGGNLLFENDGHGHFRDITHGGKPRARGHSSGSVLSSITTTTVYWISWSAMSGSVHRQRQGAQRSAFVGLPDAFSGHMYPERFEHPVLYENLGERQVPRRNSRHASGIRWDGAATRSFADLERRRLARCLLLNMMGSNHYFENQQGQAVRREDPQYFPRRSWGAMGIKFFDFDNDGRLDLLVTDMHSDMFVELAPD